GRPPEVVRDANWDAGVLARGEPGTAEGLDGVPLWRGNVSELERVVHRAMVQRRGVVQPKDVRLLALRRKLAGGAHAHRRCGRPPRSRPRSTDTRRRPPGWRLLARGCGGVTSWRGVRSRGNLCGGRWRRWSSWASCAGSAV